MNESHQATKWYAAETLSRSEAQAQHHLERQRFASFCPRFYKLRRHARRVDKVLVPVFPGYIFVRFDHSRDPWHSINGTFGVKRLVGPSSCHPQAMPEQVMRALLARCQGGNISGLYTTLQPGQQVRITNGPFADMMAEVEHLDDRGRVRVLLDILGGHTPLDVHIGDVGPV
jgi:transcriptional antiterminator RfaH